jgi:mono/diheme cytochrome c family protein
VKKILKRSGFVLLVVTAVGLALAAYVSISGIPRYAPGHVVMKVDLTPERIERGRKYATLLCVSCHLNPGTGKLTGRRIADVPQDFGIAYSRNITQDPVYGIGNWTDGELAYLLRTGVDREGQYTPPWMPKYPHMSNQDLESIIAFLRSNDPVVAAAAVNPPGVSNPTFLTKLLTHVVFKPLPFPESPVTAPRDSDKVAYGRYLTSSLGCFSCHSANFRTMNELQPEKSRGYMGGGNPTLNESGETVRSANLTFDESGIGHWSEADFARAVRTGLRPDRTIFRYPMVPMPELTESDTAAIYAYLQTVPKIRNVVVRAELRSRVADSSEGKRTYYQYGCNSCHGDDGLGIADLRHATEHYPTDPQLEAFIRHAPSFKPGTRMPAWDGVIQETEYTTLISYIRELGRKNEDATQR